MCGYRAKLSGPATLINALRIKAGPSRFRSSYLINSSPGFRTYLPTRRGRNSFIVSKHGPPQP